MENKEQSLENVLSGFFNCFGNLPDSTNAVTQKIEGNLNCNSPILSCYALSPSYNNSRNDENNSNIYCDNIQTNTVNYYNNQNSVQTPVMNYNGNNSIILTGTHNEQIQNIQIQKTDKITSDTNDSSKNIQLENFPKIENIVSTANLCCELNLRLIALQAKNAEYNPKRFSAVIMKIKEPKTTALIFSSGRIVCLGAKNEEDSKKACRKFAKIIKSLGYPVVFKEFKIQNIVGSADATFKISLMKLYIHLIKKTNYKGKSFVAYEPEQFPGLIYRMIEPNIVLLIFVSGKLVLTGGKVREDIYQGFKKIYPLLSKFKIETDMKDNKLLHRDLVDKMKEIKDVNDLIL